MISANETWILWSIIIVIATVSIYLENFSRSNCNKLNIILSVVAWDASSLAFASLIAKN